MMTPKPLTTPREAPLKVVVSTPKDPQKATELAYIQLVTRQGLSRERATALLNRK